MGISNSISVNTLFLLFFFFLVFFCVECRQREGNVRTVVDDRGGRGALAPPPPTLFCRSVNPIQTRGKIMPLTKLPVPLDSKCYLHLCQNGGRRSVNRASITLHKVEQANLQSNPIPCLLFYSFFLSFLFFSYRVFHIFNFKLYVTYIAQSGTSKFNPIPCLLFYSFLYLSLLSATMFVCSRVGSLLCLTNRIRICRVLRVSNETRGH